MIDKEENFRKFINLQYVKVRRVAAVGSLILLMINLSLTAYPYIEHRFGQYIFGVPSTYIGIPVVFVLIGVLVLLLAHIYVKKMEMYRTEQHAEIKYNPFSVYAFSPFEEMMYTNSIVPLMKGLVHILPEGSEERKKLKEDAEKFERWCRLGYIPKEEFPQNLMEYYITDKQQRL